ncbi:MAG TPA: mechanosensitive ion channel family protein [Hellea balneolensis]|uniref:Small-conductance mechanosensitive channel n=1 Tax=Hellea balneolensis TaxID=287478 RepID=A0A7C3C5I6_9PROT|nr:mechanosensitive ion channel family protein [Hellea balneolensis]
MENTTKNIKDILGNYDSGWMVTTGTHVLSGIGIFILSWVFARWASRFVRIRLGNNKGLQASDTLRPLIVVIVRYAIMLMGIYAALTISGIPASSLLAVFGAAGLAIALAVQGTLSNIAAGIMLIFLRALKVGEYIETPSVGGTILEIGLFTTQLKTSNGILTVVPNAQIWASQIVNYSRFNTRRVDVNIDIARDNDLDAALAVLEDALNTHALIINNDTAEVVLTGFRAHTAILQARFWLPTDDLRAHTSKVSLDLHRALQEGGVKLPPPLVATT